VKGVRGTKVLPSKNNDQDFVNVANNYDPFEANAGLPGSIVSAKTKASRVDQERDWEFAGEQNQQSKGKKKKKRKTIQGDGY
jgi:hypothetical protein